MLEIEYTNQFKKDIKGCKKQGKKLELIEKIVKALAQQQSLAAKYKDHKLIGNWDNFRELHIEPDWLLIYRICRETKFLTLVRTGSHSDLF